MCLGILTPDKSKKEKATNITSESKADLNPIDLDWLGLTYDIQVSRVATILISTNPTKLLSHRHGRCLPNGFLPSLVAFLQKWTRYHHLLLFAKDFLQQIQYYVYKYIYICTYKYIYIFLQTPVWDSQERWSNKEFRGFEQNSLQQFPWFGGNWMWKTPGRVSK